MQRRFWLLLAVVALVAAACGSDREDAADDGAVDGGSASEPTAAADEALPFGDLESPCGEGDGGPAGEQGVEADSITFGYGDDAGFATAPGLNRQMSHAVEALVEWCNEQGGINGRTLEGTYYDAKITEVNNAMQRACDEVFMLVGQGWSLDSAQEETRVGCELPSVPAFSVSPAFANGPWMYQGVPNPVDVTPTHGAAALAELFPAEVKKAGSLAANYAATLDSLAKAQAAFPGVGWEFDPGCDVQFAITGEADWKPFAQRLKDCGAEAVFVSGSPLPSFGNFLEAASQLEYDPIYYVDSNFYDQAFTEWNTAGYGDRVYLRFAFVPFEERGASPAVDAYMTLLEESGGDISLLGMQAASSFLLWATGVDACGADVTRQCVLDEIAGITDWTAGGLHAPTDPGTNRPPSCGALLKVTGDAYERVVPEGAAEFECDDSYVAEVAGPVVEQAKLDEDRISRVFYTGP